MRIDKKIALQLTQRQATLACAESCTGGLLGHTLTNIPGASRFFLMGIVAYDNAAKVNVLKVPVSLIRKNGAVSGPVTQRMAEQVRRILRTDYGIALSGIAGPGGGTPAKPVGLTYIAVCRKGKSTLHEFRFKGTRLQNKAQACRAALRILSQMLEES